MIRILACWMLTLTLAVGQEASFEVASVKANPGPLNRIFGYSASGPRVSYQGYPPLGLVMEAYNLEAYQVVLSRAIPQEESPYYDIVAKAPGEVALSRNEFRRMLQTLLAERFGLKLHHEMKEMPVYALVVGKNGPKFKESAADAVFSGHIGVNGRNQSITGVKYTMAELARGIRQALGVDRPVVDRTGLTGQYDIKVEATLESRYNRSPEFGDISVFTAVQEQLGLRLEPQKAMIDVVVIDRLEKPSSN